MFMGVRACMSVSVHVNVRGGDVHSMSEYMHVPLCVCVCMPLQALKSQVTLVL